jgi:hypothetical protein
MKHHRLHYFSSAIVVPLLITSTSQAALIFRDTWNTTASSLDSRFERAAPSPRQTFGANSNIPAGNQTAGIGVLTPTYSPTQPTDYHDQIVSDGTNGYLLLAGDATTPISATSTVGIATLSPFYNFNHLDTLGNAIATDVRFTLDAFTNSPGAGSYAHAAFTVGSLGTNGFNGRAESGTAAAGFSVRFVEDQFGATPSGNFIQFYDGASLVANLLPNPAGAGSMDVRLAISDSDLNPWNGVGGTTIEVFVNSTSVGSYTKGSGGYTSNFMTMEGSANFVGLNLATHTFDNLEVNSIPEPAAAMLGCFGALAMLRRRRH